MNADISSATIAPVQVPKGANVQARSRMQSDAPPQESGAVSFQSLLGALGIPLTGGPAPATDPEIDPAVLPNAEPASDAALVPAWSLSLLPNQALVRAPDSAQAGSLTGGPKGSAVPASALLASNSLANDVAETPLEQGDMPVATPGRKAAPWMSVPGGAEAGMSDSKMVGSPRDFLARVEAARVASEADAGAGQARAISAAGNGAAQSMAAAHIDTEGSGLRAYAARRPAERFGQRSVATVAAGTTPGAEGVSPGTSHGASQVYSPGAATPVPATAVAEKMHHWVMRGVQNAQLQLDAFDGGSVDVNISVMGQETIVDFRTDNVQARSLLLEAMPQLKEMLESEGLVFTGGFVGESGQRGSGSQRRDESRQDGRDATVRTGHVMAAGMAPSGRLPGTTGASIDLFV